MTDHLESATRLHQLLRAGGTSLATAESLTGGELASRFIDVPGASATFLGGVISYATELKTSMLGVSTDIITGAGVVSAECAEAMATGVKQLTGATYALATTGVAGPDPQEGKPVGLVFVGIAGPGASTSVRLDLSGDRNSIRQEACVRAMDELAAMLRREDPEVG